MEGYMADPLNIRRDDPLLMTCGGASYSFRRGDIHDF